MKDILSLLYILVFAASGFAAAAFVLKDERLIKQLALGLCFGLVMLLWFPVLFAFVFGFTLTAQILALGLAVLVGALIIILGRKRIRVGEFRLKRELPLLFTCVPIIALGTVLILNHIIVPASDGSLHVGQSTYGDLCMHLGFITSISVQKTFPPTYSILPGTSLGYPFLCDSVSSTFYTLGADLRFAAVLPSVYAFVSVVLGVYILFEDLFKKDASAALGTWLFFLGGGFGFWYFFDNAETFRNLTTAEGWSNWLNETLGLYTTVLGGTEVDMGRRLMEGWYKTPTNYVDYGLRWVNTIADMLVPQRATLFGWALLFPSLSLLRRAALDNEIKLFIPLGIVAGAMPLVHTHSFLALGLISLFLICALLIRLAARRTGGKTVAFFAVYGLIAVALAAPQLLLFTFRQSSAGGFLKLHFNWCNESDSWLWFYIKNMGFIFLLMLPAFLVSKRETKLFYSGSLLIWLLAEFIVFQPNTYDNNKLLFVWFALTCGIVADFIVTVWEKLRRSEDRIEITEPAEEGEPAAERRVRTPLIKRAAYGIVFAVLIASMLLSGVMTAAREYVSADHVGIRDGKLAYVETGYTSVSAEFVRLTDWIKENTDEDATFLTATHHNNAVAMLTGRNIVCGSPSFLYYHGVDYGERMQAVGEMYEDPESCFFEYAELYNVDYVVISSFERGRYHVQAGFFADRLKEVWSDSGIILYKVG